MFQFTKVPFWARFLFDPRPINDFGFPILEPISHGTKRWSSSSCPKSAVSFWGTGSQGNWSYKFDFWRVSWTNPGVLAKNWTMASRFPREFAEKSRHHPHGLPHFCCNIQEESLPFWRNPGTFSTLQMKQDMLANGSQMFQGRLFNGIFLKWLQIH